MYRRMFQQINRKYLANSDEQPWTNDQLNMTLHNLNHGMSKAVHQQTKLFETCVYHPQSNHLTLTEFLLTLQLLAEVANMRNTLCMHGTSTSKNSVSIFCPEDILNQVYEFVCSHQQHIDASLDCLTKTHVVQHLWTIHRAHVLQTLSGEES